MFFSLDQLTQPLKKLLTKMNEKQTILDKRFSTTRRQIQLKSICTKQKQVCRNEIQCQLRKYWSTIEQQLKMKDFIDKQMFEQILRE